MSAHDIASGLQRFLEAEGQDDLSYAESRSQSHSQSEHSTHLQTFIAGAIEHLRRHGYDVHAHQWKSVQRDLEYGGGAEYADDDKGHHAYFLDNFRGKLKEPPAASECVCGVHIVQNCYLVFRHQHIMVVGNVCILHYMPKREARKCWARRFKAYCADCKQHTRNRTACEDGKVRCSECRETAAMHQAALQRAELAERREEVRRERLKQDAERMRACEGQRLTRWRALDIQAKLRAVHEARVCSGRYLGLRYTQVPSAYLREIERRAKDPTDEQAALFFHSPAGRCLLQGQPPSSFL